MICFMEIVWICLIKYYVIKYLVLLNIKYNKYQHRFASLVYNILDKKSSASGVKSETISNRELAKELHKILIRKFDKQKVCSSFTDNI